MCPHKAGATKGNGYMDMGLLKIIDDEGVRPEINLFRENPFFTPHRRHGPYSSSRRNNRSPKHQRYPIASIDEFFDAKLDKLTISFDAGEKEAYEQMRRGAKFEKTLENVQAFLKAKAAYGVNYPYTAIQVIRFFDPAASGPTIPEKFIRLFDGLPVDEFDPLWAHGWAGTMKESESFKQPLMATTITRAIGWKSSPSVGTERLLPAVVISGQAKSS